MTSFSTNCRTVAMISVWNSVRPRVWASLVMRCLFPSLISARSAGDRLGVRQAREVGGRQAQVPSEHVGGVLSQCGRRCGGWMGAVERGGHAGGEILSDTRLVQPGKEWIRGHLRARRDIREGAVPVKQHGGVRQRGGDLVGRVIGEPGGEQ